MPTTTVRRFTPPIARIKRQDILGFEIVKPHDHDRDLTTVGGHMLRSDAWQAYITEQWLDRLERTKRRSQKLIGLTALAARAFAAGIRNERIRTNGNGRR